MELLYLGMNNSCCVMDLTIKCHDLINLIACQPNTEACVNEKCKSCPTIELESLKDF